MCVCVCGCVLFCLQKAVAPEEYLELVAVDHGLQSQPHQMAAEEKSGSEAELLVLRMTPRDKVPHHDDTVK